MASLSNFQISTQPVTSTPGSEYDDMISEVAKSEGVDAGILRAMVGAESSFNPKATSPKGAQGLLQLMPGTAKEMGVVDPYDPRQNLTGGARYFKQQLEAQGGDVNKALAAYNWGPGNLAGGGAWPQETQDYIAKITRQLGGGSAPLTPGAEIKSGELSEFLQKNTPPSTLDTALEGVKTGAQMVGQSFKESLTPVKAAQETPLGSTAGMPQLAQSALDVLYGVPEAGAALVSGMAALPIGQAAGLKEVPTSEEGLARAFETAEKVSSTATYHPKTATGQLLLKPIEVAFGTLLGTVDKVARASAPEGATEKELEDRGKAWQYVANTVLLGAPLAAKARGKVKLGPEDAAKVTPEAVEAAKVKVMEDPATPPEVKAQVAGVGAGGINDILGVVNRAEAEAIVKKRAAKVEKSKVAENQGIVDALKVDAQMREGRDASQHNKAAKIVAELGEDVKGVDLEKIKGLSPKVKERIKELITAEGVKIKPSETGTPTSEQKPIKTVTMYHGGGIAPDGSPRWVTPDIKYAEGYAKKTGGKVYAVELPIDHPQITKAFDDTGTSITAPYEPFNLEGEYAKKFKEVEGPFVIESGGVKLPETISEVIPEIKGESNPVEAKEVIKETEKFKPDTVPIKEAVKRYNYNPSEGVVSNESGPAKFFHGTSRDVKSLDPYVSEYGLFGTGTYFTDSASIAASYTKKGKGKNPSVHPAYLDIKNPMDMEAVGDRARWVEAFPEVDFSQLKEGTSNEGFYREVEETIAAEGVPKFEGAERVQDGIRGMGHDGITHIGGGRVGAEGFHRVYIAFDPEQIHSVFDFNSKKGEARGDGDSYVTIRNEASPSKGEFLSIEPGSAGEGGAGKITLGELLSEVTTSNEVVTRVLGKVLSKAVKGEKLGIRVEVDPTSRFAHYSPKENKIVVKNRGQLRTSLHEIVHAVTVRELRNDPVMQRRLYKLIGKVKNEAVKQGIFTPDQLVDIELVKTGSEFQKRFPTGSLPGKAQTAYAFVNKEEFLSQALSSPEFQQLLKSISVEERGVVRTAWDSFIEKVMEVLGVPREQKSAFEEAISIVTELAATEVKETPVPKAVGDMLALESEKVGAPEVLGEKGVVEEVGKEFEGEVKSGAEREVVDPKDIGGGGKEEVAKTFWNLMNNERGSVDITLLKETVDQVERVERIARKLGKTVEEHLDSIGLTPEQVDMFKGVIAQVPQMREEIKKEDPIVSQILLPEGEIVALKYKRDKNGEIAWTMPPITKDLAGKVLNIDKSKQWGQDIVHADPKTGKIRVEHTSNAFQKFMKATETKIQFFESAGLMELYHNARGARAASAKRLEGIKKWAEDLRKEIPEDRRENFNLALHAEQKFAKEGLEAAGFTDIKPLTPAEKVVAEKIHAHYRQMIKEGNYVRTRTGRRAIPKLLDINGKENYIALYRDLNVLRDMGLSEGIVNSDVAKLGQLSKSFNGLYNPHARKRSASDIPLELDVFKNLVKASRYTLDEIYLSPVAALAKELASARLPNPKGGKGKVTLHELNPYAAEYLSRWSDALVGKDPVASAMRNNSAFGYQMGQALGRNITTAAIGLSLRTIAVQPSSYMIQVPTYLDLRSTAYGIYRLAADRAFSREGSKYKRESTMPLIRQPEQLYENIGEYIQQGLIKGWQAWVAEKSMQPMQMVDGIVAEATWNAAEYYGRNRLGLKGKELVEFADDAVEKTQGMSGKGVVSEIQTTAGTRWLTLLQTFGINDWNFIIREVLGVKKEGVDSKKALGRAVKYVIGTYLAGELYQSMGLGNVVPDPISAYQEAKEDRKGAPAAVGAAALEFIEKIPMVGGSIKYGSSLGGMAGEWASMVPEAVGDATELLDWDKMTPKARRRNLLTVAKAMGFSLGIPMTSQIVKSIETAYRGGNPYEIIMGVYIEEQKKGRGGVLPSSTSSTLSTF